MIKTSPMKIRESARGRGFVHHWPDDSLARAISKSRTLAIFAKFHIHNATVAQNAATTAECQYIRETHCRGRHFRYLHRFYWRYRYCFRYRRIKETASRQLVVCYGRDNVRPVLINYCRIVTLNIKSGCGRGVAVKRGKSPALFARFCLCTLSVRDSVASNANMFL